LVFPIQNQFLIFAFWRCHKFLIPEFGRPGVLVFFSPAPGLILVLWFWYFVLVFALWLVSLFSLFPIPPLLVVGIGNREKKPNRDYVRPLPKKTKRKT
jgi:hypothetical protein